MNEFLVDFSAATVLGNLTKKPNKNMDFKKVRKLFLKFQRISNFPLQKMDAVLAALETEPNCVPDNMDMWTKISQQLDTFQTDVDLRNEFCNFVLTLKRRQLTVDAALTLAAEEISFLDRIATLQFEFLFPPFMDTSCRMCLKETDDLLDVFTLDKRPLRLLTIMMQDVSKDDGFSQKMCGDCWRILQNFSDTWLTWEMNQSELLRRLSGQLKEELENEEETVDEHEVELFDEGFGTTKR